MPRAESRTRPSTGSTCPLALELWTVLLPPQQYATVRTGVAKQGSSAKLWCPEILLGFSHLDVAAHVADFQSPGALEKEQIQYGPKFPSYIILLKSEVSPQAPGKQKHSQQAGQSEAQTLPLGSQRPGLDLSLMRVSSHFSSVGLFATLWTVARQAPLSMAILQARILECVAMPSSKRSSPPRDRTHVSSVFCIANRFFTH